MHVLYAFARFHQKKNALSEAKMISLWHASSSELGVLKGVKLIFRSFIKFLLFYVDTSST
jgi:hypothetical protein